MDEMDLRLSVAHQQHSINTGNVAPSEEERRDKAFGPEAGSVRLAVSGEAKGADHAKHKIRTQALGSDIRFATTIAGGSMSEENLGRALSPEEVGEEESPTLRLSAQAGSKRPPSVRLAHTPGAQGDNVLLGQREVSKLPLESYPALLVSFFYLEPFERIRNQWAFRDWALDSGAFSAKNSGVEIDLTAYIEKAKHLLATDPLLVEVFGLDVIGDWRASKANTDRMWAAGIEAIPTFHIGEPWDVLKGLAADYPKIALGGVAMKRGNEKNSWLQECFARVWPKKIHGFGCTGEKIIMALPFHSVDATNWELGPCGFGNWKSFGRMSVRGSTQNLRAEVEYYLKLERQARSRWKKEMTLLESLPEPKPPPVG